MKRKQFIILSAFPFFILFCLAIFGLNQLNGSSVAIYNSVLSKQVEEDKNLLYGTPRGIRGDHFLVLIPLIISQDINNNPEKNFDIGDGTEPIMQIVPIRNIISTFRPTTFVFFFLQNSEVAFSLYWFGEFALLLLSTYLLLLILTKSNLLISVLGSTIFLFTPFIQWWNHTSTLTWISFILIFLLMILKEQSWKKAIVWGSGLLYSMVTFLLILYPPFQISVFYIAFTILLGYSLNNFKTIKQNLKIILPVLMSVSVLFLLFSFLIYNRFSDVIKIIMDTSYPGARFIEAGGGNILHLFDGLYNILLQSDSNTAIYANQSESSNFFLLYPPIVFWVIYKSITTYLQNKKVDWIPILLSCLLILLTLWYLFPLSDFISKYSLLYLVNTNRLLIGFGYGSYLLMFYILGNSYNKNKCKIENLITIFLACLFSFFIYFIGVKLHNISPSFFEYPNLINAEYKILFTSIFTGGILYLLLNNHKKLFLSLFLIYSCASTIFINPLYKGLDILINTDLANYIQEISKNDNSKWIGYNNNYLTQYALANNASVINGVHLYPQFKIWEVLDPNKQYYELYNRYAHINVSEYEEGEEYIRLLYPDALEVNISPCDEKWDRLNVKYIITYQDMSSYSCLKLRRDFPKYGIKIYYKNLVIAQP